MTSVADRYRNLSADLAETIRAVPDDRWESPSPCEGWTARDVVAHVVETHGSFEGLVGRTLTPGPDVTVDPLAAFITASAQVQADLEDPAKAEASYDGMFGRKTFAESIDQFICFDLLVHRWDLATAASLEIHLDHEECRLARASMTGLEDHMRGPNTFGPALEPRPDADDEERLLAFLGRNPLAS